MGVVCAFLATRKVVFHSKFANMALYFAKVDCLVESNG